jgi:heme a synthase
MFAGVLPKPFFKETDPNLRRIGFWLLVVAGLVFAMILVGGATRLTHSGLSIVEWQPVSGIVPPLNDADWQAEFQRYQAFPEYQLINRGMSLDEFKGIFWWEYAHRLLGRLIGLAFALPLLYFIGKRLVPPALKGRLFVLLALGAGQGLLGWYMVQSGLEHEPAVSHYRLLAHLGLAIVLLSALLWTAWQVLKAPVFSEAKDRRLATPVTIIAMLIGFQLCLGVLVAGLKAGYIANDWPWMNGRMVPDGLFLLEPAIRNFTGNPVLVQFLHRLTGYAVFVAAWVPLILAWRGKMSRCVILASGFLADLAILQVVLGVLTLVFVVPPALGVLHQGVGVLLFLYALYLVYALRGGEHA